MIVLEAFHFDYKSFEEQMGNVTSEESMFETLLNSILTLFMGSLLAKHTAFSSLCSKEQLLSQKGTKRMASSYDILVACAGGTSKLYNVNFWATVYFPRGLTPYVWRSVCEYHSEILGPDRT